MKAIALAFGILILFLGFVLVAASQSVVEVPPQPKQTKADEVISPNAMGSESLTVNPNLTAGQVFKLDYAFRNFPQNYPEDYIIIYTNLTDPLGNLTQRYIIMIPNPQNPYQWVKAPGGDWNETSVANLTGIYRITVFPEVSVMNLTRLTVWVSEIIEGKTLYPYSYMFYVSIPVVGAGVVLSAYGVLSKTRRAKRVRREK
ncbi:hypothetical protein HXY32_01545 [Candidatus Bathyarchaeota archaeon]|nr:hypothetical protein [Candidatus Bathyarchaeota archaeon]